jgi:addiction module HigA family antidote
MKKQAVLVPGTVLKESFLDKYQISVAKLSDDIGLSPSAIRQIINNKLKISIIIALKLAKYFDTPVKYWIDIQNAYELSELDKDAALTDSLKKIPKAKKAPPAKKPAAKKALAKKAAPKAAKKAADKKPAAKKAAGKKVAPKAAKKPVAKAAKKPRAVKAPEGSSF